MTLQSQHFDKAGTTVRFNRFPYNCYFRFGLSLNGSFQKSGSIFYYLAVPPRKFIPGTLKKKTLSEKKLSALKKRHLTDFAVITGAAGGLGQAFANELAKKKINTILIDLPGKGLPEFCHYIKEKYQTQSVFFETDLTKIKNLLSLTERINKEFDIFLLINNAGIGGTKKFEEADIDYLNNIIHLNVVATTILTRQLLPNLKKRTKSYILNVASMAAFSPMGFKTVYPASKVFVYYFSRGLNQELKGTNVSVSVVSPGPMRTNKEVTRRIDSTRNFFGKIGVMTPCNVAKISIRKMFKGKPSILLNKANIFNWLLMKIVPADIKIYLITRVAFKEILAELKTKK